MHAFQVGYHFSHSATKNTMRLGEYSVNIECGGVEQTGECNEGYVTVSHGERYAIVLRSDIKSQAAIYIDGEHQGTWVVPAHQRVRLERPANSDGHFTCFDLSRDNVTASTGHTHGKKENGLIKVEFSPEKKPRLELFCNTTSYACRGGAPVSRDKLEFKEEESDNEMAFGLFSEAGTGLTGHSSQRFHSTFFDADLTKTGTIYLRLRTPSHKGSHSPQIRSIFSQPTSTPVPPPIRRGYTFSYS